MKLSRFNLKMQWFKTGIRELESVDWAYFLDEYGKLVKKTDRVLEIGASHIARTKQLAASCAELTGLEIMPERKPDDFGNVRFKTGNWEKLSGIFEPESFDMVLSSHVIEHVEHDVMAMKELYKTLKPGGAAIITTPNIMRMAAVIEKLFKGPKIFPWFEHMREYDEPGLIRLIKEAGFIKYEIIPIAFGITGWKLFIYIEPVPQKLRKYCCFWMVKLFK